MKYESVEKQFGSFAPMFRKFIESSDMDELFRYIKERSKISRIAPLHHDVFKALRVCPKDKLRVVICGIAPYHTFISNNKQESRTRPSEEFPVADGIALSCGNTSHFKPVQPSLDQFYNALEMELNDGVVDPLMIRYHSLEYLAKQGVLLTNVSLTVEENKPLSMNEAWSRYNQYFWEEVINKYFKGLCIILLGEQAWKSEQYIQPMLHYVWKLSHPAGASYKGEQWNSKGVFTEVNKMLIANNGEGIEWYERLPF